MEAMQSQQHNDLHGVALIARVEEELSNLKQSATHRPLDPPALAGCDLSPGPQLPPVDATGPQVPPVNTTFRPAAVGDVQNDVQATGDRRSRSFTSVLLAACVGVAGTFAWQSYGDAAMQFVAARAPQAIAAWAPLVLANSSRPAETPAVTEQASPAAAQPAVAEAAPAQPAQGVPPAQAAPENTAPATVALPAEVTQLLQSMAQDLATARQEIEQLKAGQDQMAREVAKVTEQKVTEQDARRTVPAPPPPRPAAAPARRPVAMLPPPKPTAQPPRSASRPVATLPPPIAAAQPQPAPPPQVAAPPQGEPQVAAVPRPPMPVQ